MDHCGPSTGRKRKRKRSKKRLGRVERLKEAVQKKSDEVSGLYRHAAVLKNLATKVTITNKALKR
jgi:SMC interacting uncharacterized protein involved in chromosome segregation